MMRYALVTGCGHGFGLCLAEKLLERGYAVAAGYINRQETLLDPLRERYPELVTQPLDVSGNESVRAAAGKVPFPCLDLIVNNTGIPGNMESRPEDEPDFDLMQQVINVNAPGALRVTAAFLPALLGGTGKTVVNISSEAGKGTAVVTQRQNNIIRILIVRSRRSYRS